MTRDGCTKTGARRLSERVGDEVRFLRAWMEKPLVVGAVAPSGPVLTREIARHVDPARPGRVVELGPGTGTATAAILARGIAPERLTVIEYNPAFCTLLRQRFPGVTVIEGDAYALDEALGRPEPGSLAAVVSCLPLFTKALPQRRDLFDEAFRLIAPGGPLIQFSYALVPAIPLAGTGIGVWTSPWVLRNVPPARVWVYRRTAAA